MVRSAGAFLPIRFDAVAACCWILRWRSGADAVNNEAHVIVLQIKSRWTLDRPNFVMLNSEKIGGDDTLASALYFTNECPAKSSISES